MPRAQWMVRQSGLVVPVQPDEMEEAVARYAGDELEHMKALVSDLREEITSLHRALSNRPTEQRLRAEIRKQQVSIERLKAEVAALRSGG